MFRTHETRLGRVPSVLRERRCSHDRSGVLGRRLPPLNGTVPKTPVPPTVPGPSDYEASARVHGCSPPGSDGALLRRRPLRTVRAAYRGTRLKQALKGLGQLAVSAHYRCPAEDGSGNERV
jgi:hypothetical protein